MAQLFAGQPCKTGTPHEAKNTLYSNHRKRLQSQPTKEDNNMNILRSYNNWRRYRTTLNELNSLSTRELSDLGISRYDIPAIARKSVRH